MVKTRKMKTGTISTEQFVEGFNPSTVLQENDFYEKKFYFSYSSLNRLLYCPEVFYKEYVLGDKEERLEAYFTEGKLIHCMLLQPEEVEKQFVTMTTKLPSENPKMVVDRIYAHHKELLANGATEKQSLAEYEEAIIDTLKDINLYQSLKTDAQRIEKMLTPETINYWKFLQTSEGKTLVDFDTYESCKAIVEKIKQDERIKKLMCLDAKQEWWTTVEIHNEMPLEMELKRFNFGLKGILDNVVVDPGNGVIRINDIKRSSKLLKDFPDAIALYRYDLQAAIYNLLVTNRFQDILSKGYTVEFRFIVIDKNNQIYPFFVSSATMKTWTTELQSVLLKADYHYSNKDYTLPYEFVQEHGVVL
jgi:hypothetical protein